MNTKLNRLFSHSVKTYNLHRSKFIAYLLLVAMLVALFPIPPGSFANMGDNAVEEKWGESDNMPTLVDGQVWTGKTVDAGNLTDDIFNVKLEALGQGYKTTSETPKPANVVLVLDASTSMNDNNKMNNMITAANQLIDSILETPGNKVSVVQFNSTASVLVSLRSTNFDIAAPGRGYLPADTFRLSTANATNIQAGMNVGYNVLNNAPNKEDAVPFMVVLSDGATWYYRTDIAAIPTYTNSGSWTQDANGYNGNGTTNNYGITAAAWTIRQAKHLKTLMPELKLYTIGYGTSGNALTTATLNPTQANIAAVTGSGGSPKRLYTELGTENAQAAYEQYYYPNGYFASSESLTSLIKAFNEILATINAHHPLADSSVVTITDTIGDDFEISGDLTMTLNSGTYTFTKSGDSYDSDPDAPTGVSVEVDDTQLTWTFPASELPYHAYSTDDNPVTQANPAVLSFNVELKAGALAGTNYYTNYNDGTAFNNRLNAAGASATFVPAATNPHYYDAEGDPIGIRVDDNENAVNYMKNTGMVKLKTTIGSLTIRKNVVAYDGTNKGPLANTGFVFNVLVPGFSGPGNIYNSSDGSEGTFTVTNGSGTVTLKDGWYATISGIPVGTDYTVTENDYSGDGYRTTVPDNAEGEIAIPADDVVFTNTYYPSATININKQISTLYTTGVAIPDGVGFPFGLYTEESTDSEIANISASVTTSGSNKNYSTTMSVKIKDLVDRELFDGSDSVTLYVHEEALTGAGAGWVRDSGFYPVTISKSGAVSYPNSANGVTVTNSYIPTSQLTVSKSLVGGSLDKEFNFTIEIDAPANYSYAYSLTVAGGTPEALTGTGSKTINVSLKGNETAVITGIPVGTPYTVTEDDYDGDHYYSSLTNNTTSGVVSAQGSTVGVTNTYKTQNLTIKKVVAGIQTDKEFDFEVAYGSTTKTFSLAHNESEVLLNVPVGVEYTVKETNGAGYTTTVRKTVGDTAGGDEAYSSNGYVLTLTDKATELIFTNTFKEGQLTVSKAVSGPEPAGSEYEIRVTFAGGNLLSEIAAAIDGQNVAATSTGVFDITLGAGESALFTNIPEGVTYTVNETDAGSADSVSYSYSDSAKVIADKDQDTVTVTNTYDTPSVLTISKVVPSTGYDASPDGRFGFSVRFYNIVEGEGDEPPTEQDYTLKSFEMPTAPAGANFTKVSQGYTFTLGAGESLTFDNLPVGIHYQVEETSTQGARASALKVKGDDQDDLTATGTIIGSANDLVTVTYHNSFNRDTGTLKLTKVVTGDLVVAPAQYAFEVTFTGQTDVSLPGVTGAIEGNSIKFNVSLVKDGSVTFNGIKAGTQYSIVETTDADSTTFNPGSSGTFVLDGWSVEDVEITATNNYELPETETVKNAYSGDKLISDNIGGVYVGDQVTYVIQVENKGPHSVMLEKIEDAMFGAAITDLTVNGPDGAIPFTLDTAGESKYLVLTGGVELEKNEKVTVSYKTTFSSGGEKANTATSHAEYKSVDITSDDDATITVFNPSDVSIVKKVAEGNANTDTIAAEAYKDSVAVGYKDFVTYKITVTNTGEADLYSATITDQQLTAENVISVTLNGSELNGSDEDPDYTIEDHDLKLKGVLEPDDVVVVLYSLKAQNDYENIAIINAHDGLNGLEEEDEANVTIEIPGIEVEKTGDKGTVITGESVDYTITIENSYDRILDLVSVTDSFFKPDEDYTVSNIRYSIDGGVAVDIDPDMIDTTTGTVNFGTDNEGSVTYPEFDEDVVITYTVTFHEAGTYVNDADAVAGYRGYLVDDGDDWSVRVKDPSGILVTKKVNGQDEVTIRSGQTVTYTVTVENKGQVPLNLSTFDDAIFATSGVNITKLVLIDGDTETPLGWHQDDVDKNIIYVHAPLAPIPEFFVAQDEGGEEDWLFLKPGMSVLLTYTRAMSAAYTNTVIATLYEADETVLTDDDSARVRIRRPDRPDPPTPPTPDPIIIPEDSVPEGPVDPEVIIPEEEVPLGPVPKTGVDDNMGLMAFLMIGSLAGIGALIRKRRLEKE